jgi:acetyl/propionyl-CoA carboxylase alpha subunit
MYAEQKLLVANRAEIAVRIIRTAKRLGITTVAIYTPSDALAPHVSIADYAVPLLGQANAESESEFRAYLSASSILAICKAHAITLVHPGYGFLSENHEFAFLVREAGITWLGPSPEVIRTMGLKHEARIIAIKAGLAVVPGSEGLVPEVEEAVKIIKEIGYPVMIKATAGGGGMSLVVCFDEADLRQKFDATRQRAQVRLLMLPWTRPAHLP